MHYKIIVRNFKMKLKKENQYIMLVCFTSCLSTVHVDNSADLYQPLTGT